MNTFRRIRLAAVGAVALAAASTVAASQPPVSSRNGAGIAQRGAHGGDRKAGERQGGIRGGEGRRGARGPGFARGMLQGITLTASQQEQLRAMQQRFIAQRPDSLRPRQRPDSAARVAMIALRQQAFERNASEIRSILTSDQRATFDQNVRTMRENIAKAPGHFRKGGRGGR